MLQIPDGVIEVSDVIKEYNDNDYNNINNNNISTNINNDYVLSIAILITVLIILYLSQ